jgi:hypothetical protein
MHSFVGCVESTINTTLGAYNAPYLTISIVWLWRPHKLEDGAEIGGDYEIIRFWSQKTCFLTPMNFKNQCIIKSRSGDF